MSKFQSQSQYIFQRKRASFTKRFFTKGLNASSFILIGLKEQGKSLLNEMPDWPQFTIFKEMAGVGRYGRYKKQEFKKKTLTAALYRLKKQGLVIKDPKKKIYYLTEEGKKFMAYIEDRYGVLKKKWDGKIRVVIFDIPEKKRKWREWMRAELQLLQFKPFQKSVYIGKCPLPESFYKEIVQNDLEECVFIFTMSEFDRKQIMKVLNKGE